MAISLPKPSAIRNYLYEYVLIGLATAVIGLSYIVVDLNKFIRTDVMQMNVNNQQVIRDVNNTMQQFMNYRRFTQPEDKKASDDKTGN